jgi:uncharacterized membrane protein YfcA
MDTGFGLLVATHQSRNCKEGQADLSFDFAMLKGQDCLESEVATIHMAVAAATAMAAGLMRGFAGFGSGMLMAPIFAILFGPVDAVTMVAILELFASVQLLPQVLKDTQWDFVAPLGLSAMLFMPLGAYVLRSADPALLTRLMAAVVLIFVIILMAGWRYSSEKKLLVTLGVGAVSGALMAATSMGNPPIVLYLLAGQNRARTIRANIIAYFAVTQIALLSVLGLMAMVALPAVVRAILLTPGYLLAALVGSRLFRQSDEKLYRRTTIAFLLVIGIYGLLH